ncbi:uncharacterized protein LAJ45_04182 [Morchella importuna]|uniref:uncharacterized protein n=1 Tax=Morchella importuna TaxID=1174673 RepID=UPI001E8DBE25|nr:uncharacterized protein LAJ45_04182 [Morchella importuna]KAH8151561.1 hypothetical protein LAJ45_04182 [Morchella importuna]
MASLNSIGVKLIASGKEPIVDIIAVHGLHGDAYKTWTAKPEKAGGAEVMWLRDLLPTEIPNARILAYGYDSDPGKFLGGASTSMVHHHAFTLVSELYFFRRREHERRRPIIFVCHSLGGIVVKRALIYSNSCNLSHNVHLRAIKVSTYGVLFLGTPHMGSDLAKWGKMAEMIFRLVTPKALVDSNSALLKTLESNSETLQNITDNFLGISRDFKLFFCWEELKTSIPGVGKELIVEYSSAAPEALADAGRAAIHANHSDMCKFYDVNSPGWNVVAGCLYDFAQQASAAIERGWAQETRRNVQETRDYVTNVIQNTEERLSSTPMLPHNSRTSSPGSMRVVTRGVEGGFIQPDEISEFGEHYESANTSHNLLLIKNTPFVKPLSLQENKYFEGGDDELKIIHSILTDQNKRVVSISGVTGAGKTHLAREYFFHRKSEFPGGAFWIDCKHSGDTLSTESLDLGYCMIAEELGLSNQQNINKHQNVDPKLSTRFEVNNWFDKHDGWLLVLDGANVETNNEVNLLSEYVPKSKGGSIILTTLNSSFAGAARLGSPERLDLGRITEDEAVRMVMHYSQINSPSGVEVEAAKKLVKHLEYNPLAIQSAGSYIKGKKVSVSDYLKKYEKRPFVEREFLEPFHIIFDRLDIRYEEAGNLLRLIAFLHREIPVQMLEFGIKYIPQHIQVRAGDADRRDLNNTIGHLLAYSMVDRIGKQSDDVQIDTLVIHSVIQEVCISRLRKTPGELKKWLELAIGMYCKSFDTMELRQYRAKFLVSDYRRYELHGVRLLEHANKHKLAKVELERVLEKLREAINGDDQTEGPRISMFASGSGSDSAPETPSVSPESSRHPTWNDNPGVVRPAGSSQIGSVDRLREHLSQKEHWRRLAEHDTSYDSDIEYQPTRRPHRTHFPRPRTGEKPYTFRYEPPGIPRNGQYMNSRHTNDQSQPADTEKNSPLGSRLRSLLRAPTGFSSIPPQSQYNWPWNRNHSPPQSAPLQSPSTPMQATQGNSTFPISSGVQTPVRGRSPVRKGWGSLSGIQLPIDLVPNSYGGDGLHAPAYDDDSLHADPEEFPFGGSGGPSHYLPPQIKTPVDYQGKGGILDMPYEPSHTVAVNQTKPFSPGFSPSRDLSSSPIARSIVGPRYDRPPSAAWSEPILEHEDDYSPQASPFSSTNMIRARSSTAATSERKSPRIAQLQGLASTQALGHQRSISGGGRPLPRSKANPIHRVVSEPLQVLSTEPNRASHSPGLGIDGLHIPFGLPEVTVAPHSPDIMTSERFAGGMLRSEDEDLLRGEHYLGERRSSVPERAVEVGSTDMQRSISEPIAGLGVSIRRRSPLREQKSHND